MKKPLLVGAAGCGSIIAEFGFNLDRRLTHRASEKPLEHLFRRDRIAVTRQRFGMGAA